MLDTGLRAGLWVGLGTVLLAGLLWLVQHERAVGDARGADRVQQAWDAERIQLQAQAINDAAANAAETERRLSAQQEVIRETTAQLDRARADADAARAARQRLLDAQRAYIAAALGGASLDPSAAGSGPTAAAAIDVLADLRGRADDTAGELAAALDAAHAAGIACERAYDTLIDPEDRRALLSAIRAE